MARLLTFLMRSLALNVIVNSELTRKKLKRNAERQMICEEVREKSVKKSQIKRGSTQR